MTPSPDRQRAPSFRDKVREAIEFVDEKLFPVWRSLGSWVRTPLVFFLPLLIGVLFQWILFQIVTVNDRLGLLTKWDFWIPIIIFGFLALVYYGVFRSQQRSINRSKIKAQLNFALRLFYEEMGFEAEDYDTGVRCTIWGPRDRYDLIVDKPDVNDIVMYQVVNYYPSKVKIGPSTFHEYGRAGRLFRIARKIKDEVRCVGLLGLAVSQTIDTRRPDIYLETIPTGATFEEYMINNWNFTESRAKRLSHDRISYLCIPFLDVDGTQLLGVLHCDTKKSDMLTRELGERAQNFLNYFALIMSQQVTKQGG